MTQTDLLNEIRNSLIPVARRSRALFALSLAPIACLAALGGLASSAAPSTPGTRGSASEVAVDNSAVRVYAQRDGEATHFYVDNEEYSEVTMTFDMALKNLQGDVTFPYTTTFPPRQKTEAFTLSPAGPGTKWEYSYTNYYKLGSNCARHEDSFIYDLPYGPGERFKVTQGYNGKFSHKGSNQYAIDWQMPVGTIVRAARGGVVVRAKDDSDRGGGSMAYDKFNNYVLIRHDDGTLGHYCHLQKGGCLVKVGQVVAAGDPIARSGSTGFSSGPHLHFCVFKTKNGRERISIPVKFRTALDESITLTSGRTYRAPEVQTAQNKTITADAGTVPTHLVR